MTAKVIPIRVVGEDRSADPLILQASLARFDRELGTLFRLFESGVVTSCDRRNIPHHTYADALEDGLARLRTDLEVRLFR